MRCLILVAFALVWLWAVPSTAARCNVGTLPDEDGCQTTTPSNFQGDWQIMAFHLCEEKSDADSCPTGGTVADPEFDMVADAVGIPQRVMFSLDSQTTCTAGEVTIIGRNESGGDDHTVGTMTVGTGRVNTLILSEWRHQFVTANITTALAGCVANSFNVGMRLYYIKIHR